MFYAVELPREVQSALGRLRPAEQDHDHDYRWVDPKLIHLTLAFLGEQPDERLPELDTVGRRAAAASHPGLLALGVAGSFGSRRAPRVLWVDLTGDLDALSGLHQALDNALRVAGFPTEDRPFRPHITLARRREQARGGAPVGWPPIVEPKTFNLDRLTLMQSRLSPRGPTYTEVFQFPFAG